MSESRENTVRHAETLMATVRDPHEPDLDALEITDSFGTTIWCSSYAGESRWLVYIRNRQRYDTDTRRDESAHSVRNMLTGAIADELCGLGTAVNYTRKRETPL
jgi:hypothetical protein